MTETEARAWIDKIKAAQDDDEKAHVIEDDMLWAYIRKKEFMGDPVAKILMESLHFSRWCA